MGIKGLLKALNPLLVPADGGIGSGSGSGGGGAHLSGQHAGSQQGQQAQQQGNGKYHITAFASTTLAVDASSWLYRAGYACAEALVESIESGQKSIQAEAATVRYVTNRIDQLLAGAQVKSVILVFDGKRCPLKAGTNRDREARRQANLKEARRLRAAGRHAEAREKYKLCVKATDDMARAVAEKVAAKYGGQKRQNHFGVLPKVRCVFAPYEADAQLAKLCVDGVADAVITEDSDILVYSAAAGVAFPVIYKLDKDTGLCDVVSMDWLLSASTSSNSGTTQAKPRPKPLGERKVDRLVSVRRYLPAYGAQSGDKKTSSSKSSSKGNKGKNGSGTDGPMLSALRSMVNLEERKPGAGRRAFVQSCVLCGCDYAPGLVAGVGTVGAFKQIKENRNRDESIRFRRILMPFRGKIQPYKDDDEDEEENGNERNDAGDIDDSDGEGGGPSDSQSSVSTQKSKSRRDQEMERLNVYESLLAKSEAVFYYHCVLNVSDGTIVHLTEPQVAVSGEGSSSIAAAKTRKSRLSADSLSDDEDDASATTATSTATSVAPTTGDPRRFHPSTKRFDGDISFVGSLDVSTVTSVPARSMITKALSSLTRTPSAGPISNPYSSSNTASIGRSSSAPPANSMVRVREKTSKASPTLHDLFGAAAKSPKAVQSRQQPQGQGGSSTEDAGRSASSNMFAGFSHDDEKGSNTDDDVVLVDDSEETNAHTQPTIRKEPSEEEAKSSDATGDTSATSRHFSSNPNPTTGEKRKVSFDSPEKEEEQHASSASPAKKNAEKSPASDSSSFWSDGDSRDCIIVDEPPSKSSSGSSKPRKSGTGTSFAAAHHSHSKAAAPNKVQGGEENTGNASSSSASSSNYISVFRSSQKDRMPRGSHKKSKGGSSAKSGSGSLLAGFDRQRKNAAADGTSVIRENLDDRQRRLSNTIRSRSGSSASSTGGGGRGGAKKRKSTGDQNLSTFFQPLDISKKTRKSI